jgi:hypothetical protein
MNNDGITKRLALLKELVPTATVLGANGFQIEVVLEKLGFDLRQQYDALIGRELPDELGRLASKLNPSVVEVGNEPIRRGRRW